MSEQDQYLQIGNEFTCIRVRKKHSKNGEFLEIESIKNHSKITLDAMQLESLALLKPEHFSEFFELNFGIGVDKK